MNETATLAQYVSDVKLDGVPEHVVRYTKSLILDQLGCQIGGSQLPWSDKTFSVIAALSATGESTVVGRKHGLSPDAAAFVNGAFGHANEFDDTHIESPNHPGAIVIPAALATGETVRASGVDFLCAVIAGYEALLRITYSVNPGMMVRGHHPPLASGPFGAAAAAARIYGLDAADTQNALAIAGSYAGGTLEHTRAGGSAKRMHCAIPAQAGVRAALLSAAGITGPSTILEGERGFCEVFTAEADASRLTRTLGDEYILLETAIKQYSCGYPIHPALDILKRLRAKRAITPDQIASVDVYSPSATAVSHVGHITAPTDVLGAQFSLPFTLAMFLSGWKCQLHDYQEVSLEDEQLLELSQCIRMHLDDTDPSKTFMRTRVVVTLRNGEHLTDSTDHVRGGSKEPLTDVEISDKFLALVSPTVGTRAAVELERTVGELESLEDVRELSAMLRF